MKITEEKGKIIIDGDNVTTIKTPKDMGIFDIGEWLVERLGYSGYKKEDIQIVNFTFISSDQAGI